MCTIKGSMGTTTLSRTFQWDTYDVQDAPYNVQDALYDKQDALYYVHDEYI